MPETAQYVAEHHEHKRDDVDHVNPSGGAIALGQSLGMSGALLMTATYNLYRTGGSYALCTMCIGVGKGIASINERTQSKYDTFLVHYIYKMYH